MDENIVAHQARGRSECTESITHLEAELMPMMPRDIEREGNFRPFHWLSDRTASRPWRKDEKGGTILASVAPASQTKAPGCPWFIVVITTSSYHRLTGGGEESQKQMKCRVTLKKVYSRLRCLGQKGMWFRTEVSEGGLAKQQGGT